MSGGLRGAKFFYDVMAKADDVINFANFDRDNNDTVDACFFIVPNYLGNFGNNTGRFLVLDDWDYKTKDLNARGDTVIVATDRLTLIKANDQNRVVSISAHEWGHALFGLTDWYGTNGVTNWGLGAFSIMGTSSQGFPQKRAVPVDPVHRVDVGWVTPITVTSPLYLDTIPDYLTTGTVYKIPYSSSQYFYVTNYRGKNYPNPASAFWQDKYGGFGLLIWHVGGPKQIDVELAHGLWDMTDTCTTSSANTVWSGLDSVDTC